MPTDNRQTSAKVMMRQYCLRMAINRYFRYLSGKSANLSSFVLRRFLIGLGLELFRDQVCRRIALANDHF